MGQSKKVVVQAKKARGTVNSSTANDNSTTSGSAAGGSERAPENPNAGHVALGPLGSEGNGRSRNIRKATAKIFWGKITRALFQYVTSLKLLMGCFGLGIYIVSDMELGKLGIFLWNNSGPKSTILAYGEYIYEILMGVSMLALVAQKTFGKWTKIMFRLWATTALLVLLITLFICPVLHFFNYSNPGRLISIGMIQADPIYWMLLAGWMTLNQLLVFSAYLHGGDYATRTRDDQPQLNSQA